MPEYVIGLDVGGTRVKSGAVTRTGELLESGIAKTPVTEGPKALLDGLAKEIRRIRRKLKADPTGVAIGLSGAVDPKKGTVLLPGKIKNLENFPIVPRLRKAVGVPVVADNDGRLSILAEKAYGLARNRRWAVTVTLGTGVGSGVMLDGQVLRDPHLQFGTQLGHLVMQATGGKLCLTGPRGTAETLCSATALALAVRDGLQRGIPSVLSDLYFKDPHAVDFKAVIGGVEKKDRLCLDCLNTWTELLGWLLVSAVHAYAPEIVILSGGATNAAQHFLSKVRRQVREHVFRYPPGKPVRIVVSKIREHAGVLGAAALAWERFGERHGSPES